MSDDKVQLIQNVMTENPDLSDVVSFWDNGLYTVKSLI